MKQFNNPELCTYLSSVGVPAPRIEQMLNAIEGLPLKEALTVLTTTPQFITWESHKGLLNLQKLLALSPAKPNRSKRK